MKTWMEKLIRKLLTREVITYVIFGVLTTAVNFLAFYLLNDLMRMHYFWANALAWVVAVVFAFVTNKQFVFESKSWKLKSTLKEAIGFTGGRVVTLLLEQGGMLLFVEAIHMNENLAKAILAVIVVILNYVFSKLWIFVRKDVQQ